MGNRLFFLSLFYGETLIAVSGYFLMTLMTLNCVLFSCVMRHSLKYMKIALQKALEALKVKNDTAMVIRTALRAFVSVLEGFYLWVCDEKTEGALRL